MAVLKEHNFEQYKEKYDAFNKKYNSWDDGRASEKVVEIIKETMK
ncbi:MAG: CDP-glycerol glycerophosphotransferase family protein [Acetivibrio ethanolgignens]